MMENAGMFALLPLPIIAEVFSYVYTADGAGTAPLILCRSLYPIAKNALEEAGEITGVAWNLSGFVLGTCEMFDNHSIRHLLQQPPISSPQTIAYSSHRIVVRYPLYDYDQDRLSMPVYYRSSRGHFTVGDMAARARKFYLGYFTPDEAAFLQNQAASILQRYEQRFPSPDLGSFFEKLSLHQSNVLEHLCKGTLQRLAITSYNIIRPNTFKVYVQ